MTTLVHSSTSRRVKTQTSIVEKVISCISQPHQRFPEPLLFQITRYLYNNPLKLTQPVFKQYASSALNDQMKYLLVKTSPAQCPQDEPSKRSSFLTIVKSWKPQNLDNKSCNEIILKGKYFLSHLSLSDITINNKNAPQVAQNEEDWDVESFEARQKQKGKLHHLICDNYELVYFNLMSIKHYQNNRKMNSDVLKAFQFLMKFSIAVIRIDPNYSSTLKLGSEGNYLYFCNSTLANKSQTKTINFPWLQSKDGQWIFEKCYTNCSLKAYSLVRYPLSRSCQTFVTQKLQCFQQEDIWVRSIEG